jgi:hypothetical protein
VENLCPWLPESAIFLTARLIPEVPWAWMVAHVRMGRAGGVHMATVLTWTCCLGTESTGLRDHQGTLQFMEGRVACGPHPASCSHPGTPEPGAGSCGTRPLPSGQDLNGEVQPYTWATQQ